MRAAVVVHLALLGFFKYYGFFVDSVADATQSIGLNLSPPILEIALPVGISFFTFHALSYVIDIGRGELEPLRLDEHALYLSFFPHLVAGPIVRASELGPQLRQRPDPRRVPSGEAFRLIAAGLFKKVVVSSYVATELVDPVFGAPGAHGPLDLLVGVYAYAIQIYADFSGYTDIAIGCALLLGLRFPQNFDAPYRALSLQDFWRRWHMTLSRWLRDYLYIPLGGSRGTVRFTYRNLFLTMVIGGLWHGAATTFVVWGAIHGGFLVLERQVKARWRERVPHPVLPSFVTSVLQWVLTFHVVCLAWIFFRAESVGAAFDVLGGILAGSQPSDLVTPLLLVTITLMLASQFVPPSAVDPGAGPLQRPWPRAAGGVARRRPHRHRRARPRRRRPLHLLPVLMATTGDLAPPPPHTAPRPARSRRRRGEEPAGRILVVMLVALGLAALVNADALVERAERKPLGAGRDRSLLVWHPVQDIAHVTQLHRLRALGDALVGNEDRGGDLVPKVVTELAPPPDTVVRPTLRPPAAGDPLRVYIGGDSIVRDAGDAFLEIASGSPLFDTTLHYENATGLTRPDFYDWPAAIAEDMASHRPEVVFLLFGGNDSQALVAPSGETFKGPSEPGWQAEYRATGGAGDGPGAGRRPPRLLDRPTADARGRLQRSRRHHEPHLPRGGGSPLVDVLRRHGASVR